MYKSLLCEYKSGTRVGSIYTRNFKLALKCTKNPFCPYNKPNTRHISPFKQNRHIGYIGNYERNRDFTKTDTLNRTKQ